MKPYYKKSNFFFVFVLIIIGYIVPNKSIGQTSPPFGGTIFIDPDIITPTDPTTFQDLLPMGRGFRTMYDRRVANWIRVNAYLFNAIFDDGLSAEIQVNPEFGSSSLAQIEAAKYAPVIGQLPTALRANVETVWIHKGVNPFGGGNKNLLIHTGQAIRYENDGILEETFVHEAAHTSLDPTHRSAMGWLAAQAADPTFISTYARDFPNREDIAESFLPYLAIRYRADRISSTLENTILQTMPNRIAYFDNLGLDMYPITSSVCAEDQVLSGNLIKDAYTASGTISTNGTTTITVGSNVTITAGTTITLKDGTHFQQGSEVLLTIGDCVGSSSFLPTTIAVSKVKNVEEISLTETSSLNVYPNPSSHKMTILYTLEQASSTNLSIYDLQGQRIIVVLANVHQAAGNYQTELLVDDLLAGTYFMSLQTDENYLVEKITVLK